MLMTINDDDYKILERDANGDLNIKSKLIKNTKSPQNNSDACNK